MILTVTLNPAIDKVYQVDNFAVGSVFRPGGLWNTAGGKGLNVARVCRILGEDVMATGFSGGSNGQFIRKEIEKLGIKDEFVEVDGETRICIAINDPVKGTSTEVLESGPIISDEEQEEFLKNFELLVPKANIIAASGSMPKGLEKDFYGKLIEIAHRHQKPIILDTSGDALKHSIAFRPFMIKPNENEINAIANIEPADEGAVADVARQIHSDGIQLVCITLGKAGCLAVWNDGVYRFRHPVLEVVNTVGSGDSFVAGCASAFSRGMDFKEAIVLGIASGMANTQFHETGKVSKELVDKYKAMVTVEKYSV